MNAMNQSQTSSTLSILKRSPLIAEDGITMTASVIDGTISQMTRRRRAQKGRKEPELEFFEMTVLAFQLSHPNSKTLLKVDRQQMYEECKAAHSSFHEWPRWINATLTRIMLNERYNKEQNVNQSMRQSMHIQNKIQQKSKSRQRSKRKESSDSLRASRVSFLGQSFVTTRPLVVEDEFIQEQ